MVLSVSWKTGKELNKLKEPDNDNFISIKVNSDAEKGLATRYLVRGLPTMWFLEENGEKIGYHPGYVASDMFLPYLRYIQSDKYKNMSFQDFLKRS